MAGRLSRVRRAAFLLALVVSAALYSYSVAGIMGTSSQLRSAVSARSVERAVTISYPPPAEAHENCRDRADAERVEL